LLNTSKIWVSLTHLFDIDIDSLAKATKRHARSTVHSIHSKHSHEMSHLISLSRREIRWFYNTSPPEHNSLVQ
jgi:hypothetical protein